MLLTSLTTAGGTGSPEITMPAETDTSPTESGG